MVSCPGLGKAGGPAAWEVQSSHDFILSQPQPHCLGQGVGEPPPPAPRASAAGGGWSSDFCPQLSRPPDPALGCLEAAPKSRLAPSLGEARWHSPCLRPGRRLLGWVPGLYSVVWCVSRCSDFSLDEVTNSSPFAGLKAPHPREPFCPGKQGQWVTLSL